MVHSEGGHPLAARRLPKRPRARDDPRYERDKETMLAPAALRAIHPLGKSPTAADIQMSFPIEAARQRARLTQGTRPHLHAYLERIRSRPAYERALERGGPYDLATA